jgi:hypothetical protein
MERASGKSNSSKKLHKEGHDPMSNHLLIPPAGGPVLNFNGRSYDPAKGAQSVVDFDAAVLEANGWSIQAETGVTASRPAHPVVGQKFYDSTVSHTVVWDGKAWRDEAGTSR